MRRSINLRAFPRDYPLDRCLAISRDAGFHAVEVNLEPEGPCSLTDDPTTLQAVRRTVERHGLRVSSVYSREQWTVPATSGNPAKRERWQTVVRTLIHAAALVGADLVLVVVGGVDTTLLSREPEIVPYAMAYQRAREALARLGDEAAAHEVKLGVENVWSKFLLSPVEAKTLLDEVAQPNVGMYLDVGNCLAFGFPEDWVETLGSRIFGVHMKDFRVATGTIHGFVGLLEGDVNWLAVMRALRQVGYDEYLTAEVLPPYRFASERLIFETAEALRAIMQL